MPALVIGLGGVWTEALDDVAVVPLPATGERVAAALRSLRGAPLLVDERDGPAADLDAAAELAAAAGSLALERGLELLELNPVVASTRARSRSTRWPAPGTAEMAGAANQVERVGIVGAGFMGPGIAEAVARAGIAVWPARAQHAPLDRSRDRAGGSIGARRRGREARAPPRRDATRARVSWTTDRRARLAATW